MQSYGIEVILLRLLKNYLSARQQRVFLHGQTSSWQNVSAGVPQGSVLGPLLFLIYINDLLDGITSSCKIFADSTSLFSKIERKSCSNFKLDKGLKTISKWAFRWKVLFNRDPRKQPREVGFSHKNDNGDFNNKDYQLTNSLKHLGSVLGSKLDFNEHVNNKVNGINK